MATKVIRLHVEQDAYVTLEDVDPDISLEEGKRLALQALDASGGAEWATDFAYEEWAD